MSFAKSEMSLSCKPKSLSAAFCIMAGSVEMPTVKIEGTSIRMFCFDSALFKSTEMERGVKSRKVYDCIKGHINAAPPWIHFALRYVPSLLGEILP